MHGDHIFGLPGLLASLGLSGNSSGVDLYGPEPLERYLKDIFRNSSSRVSYPLHVHRVKDASENNKLIFEDEDFQVLCTPLIHRVPAYAYRIDQKPKPGRFDIELAQKLGIPPGPCYASLKRGEQITLDDGRIFDGKKFCGPDQPGNSVVYCTDTIFSKAAIALAKGADLLIHESTYSHEDAEMAFQRQHSTSTMAAQVAKEACVHQLALTHLSPRYIKGNRVTPDDLLAEAQEIFPNTLIAKDFLSIEVKSNNKSLHSV